MDGLEEIEAEKDEERKAKRRIKDAERREAKKAEKEFANGGVVPSPIGEILIDVSRVVGLEIPCRNNECSHTFETVTDKEHALSVGCPICGI